jgi:hypothetical protein
MMQEKRANPMALIRFCAASIALAAALLSLAGCGNNVVNPAPDRLSTEAAVPIPPSQVIIPATISLSDLERRINAELPAKLYTIDKVEKACLPAQRVLGLKVTPNVGCRIVGAVTRGHIRVFGRGETLFLTMPVSATVSAKNIGGIIKSETATGGGEVRAKVRLDVSRDWQPQARLLIDYDWTRKPGVTVLGHRFTFAHQADEKLAKVISRLERDIPKHLLALNPKAKIEKAWASGFTTILVNRANPPVWLRLTPEQLGYGGYRVTQDKLLLNLALTAKLETFVGDRPADPAKVPLPPAQTFTDKGGFQLQVPVIASYEQLEPVLDKALSKVASRGIAVPEIGDIRVKFGKSTIYATTNGRLAVGLAVSAKTGRWPFATKGKVWLTGIAYNEPGSQRVMVRDLTVQGTSDDRAGRLLLAIANSDQVEDALSHAVKLDFANDLEKLIAKIRSALAEKRIGDFVVNTRIEKFEHGPITPVAQGLYMPVSVSGVATVSVQSDKGNSPAIRK